jgi:diguanylate cyclase (GGDEF)-like protein/PAS domain S-box-containing protein
MVNETAGCAHATATAAAMETGSRNAAGTPRTTLLHWLSGLQVNTWMLGAIFGITAVILLNGAQTAILNWAAFVGLNLLLVSRLGGARAHHLLEQPAVLSASAAAAGFGWAVAVVIADELAGASSGPLATLAVSYALVLLSLPLFGHRQHAFAALLGAYGAPVGWVLSTHYGPAVAVAALGFGLLPPLVAARVLTRSLDPLSRLLDHTLAELGHGPSEAVAGARDAVDFLDDARTRLGQVQHALTDLAQLQATIGALSDGIVLLDRDCRIKFMNPVAEVLTGYALREARGQFVNFVVDLQAPGSCELTRVMTYEALRTGGTQRLDDRATLRRRDGVAYGIDFSVTALRRGDDPAGAVVVLRDVTERREQLRAMSWRAAHDPLTGLSNRTDFEQRLRETLARDAGERRVHHALCMFDVDHFSSINDTFGSQAGNQVIQRIGELLRQQIRGVDLAARLDGDRFGVLLFNCPLNKAALIAEALRRRIAELAVEWEGSEITVRVSGGVLGMTQGECQLPDALSAVDKACALAKRAGGNRLHTLDTADEHLRGHEQLFSRVREIQAALRFDRFELLFQPVLPLSGESGAGYCELLLRMRNGKDGMLSPRDFLRAAERYHLLPEIDRWTVKAALDALRLEHPGLAQADAVAFSVSEQSVSDEHFAAFVLDAIRESGIDPTRLCFELAESHLIRQWDRACIFIADVKQLGCRVALDGFGLGTHSFQLLKRLQVDYLKIHEDFVRNIASNSVDYEIVLGITRVARTLRIRTIASGVGNLACREVLRGLGVDYAQGFLVEPPRPVSVARALHKARGAHRAAARAAVDPRVARGRDRAMHPELVP